MAKKRPTTKSKARKPANNDTVPDSGPNAENEGPADDESVWSSEVANINELIVGLSPAVSAASLQLTSARDTYLAGLNSVYAQQQSYITQQASTVQSVKTILQKND